LKTCSHAHAASPNDFSPTMRELPLSVWNARRSVVISARSSGATASCVLAERAGLDDLARLLEEDLAHLVVVLEVLDQRDRRHRLERHRRADRREAGRLGRRRDEVDERLRELAARAGDVGVVARRAERFLRVQHGGGERG
jgi:hypothetical protein